jgi:hypothetical protein
MTDEDTAKQITLSAASPNSEPLTYTILSQPTNGVLSGSGSNQTYTPNLNFTGNDSFTYRVSQNGKTSNIATVNITVNSINDAPVLSPIGNKTVFLGSTLTFTAQATDIDLPAQTLTYSLAGAVPVGASINPMTGVFSWTPDSSQFGQSYSITVQVIDSEGLTAQETITVTIEYGVVALFDQTKAHNSGSNVAIKLKIVDVNGVNLSAASIQLVAVRVDPGNLSAQSPGDLNPTNVFSFDSTSQSYQYNLKSEQTWAPGTYRLVFRIVGDPVEHFVSFNIR